MKGRKKKSKSLPWKTICSVVVIALGVLLFKPAVTVYCWLFEQPRVGTQLFSPLGKPLRSLYNDWVAEEYDPSPALGRLAELINQELPTGADLEDLHRHIRKHYNGEVEKGWSLRVGEEEGYIVLPSHDTYEIQACAIPKVWMNDPRLVVQYVTSENQYLYTQILLDHFKGYYHSEIVTPP